MTLTEGEGLAAVEIAEVLKKNGHLAYFAGGCVRDSLMSKPSQDIDIATSASPDQVQSLFSQTVAVGKQFGVIIVQHKEYDFEVATFRTDGEYEDGRRPISIQFSTPEADAQRRDFTVNGLFFDPFENKVIDYVEGVKDIENKVIRAIGEPLHRFEEDQLRLLRAIRFASNLDFQIEKETFLAIRKMALSIQTVSHERIHDEMVKILTRPYAARGISLLLDAELFKFIFPQLSKFAESTSHYYQRVKKLIDLIAPKTEVEGFACLYYGIFFEGDLNSPAVFSELKLLRVPNEVIKIMQSIADDIRFYKGFDQLREGQQKLVLGDEWFDFKFRLFKNWTEMADQSTNQITHIENCIERFKGENLTPAALVDGHDLMNWGVPQGPQVKLILDELYLRQLEGGVRSKEECSQLIDQLKRDL